MIAYMCCCLPSHLAHTSPTSQQASKPASQQPAASKPAASKPVSKQPASRRNVS